MTSPRRAWPRRVVPIAGGLLGAALVGLLVIPLFALVVSVAPGEFVSGLSHPLFGRALRLSLQTTAVSLTLTVVLGTPLSWWLAASSSKGARIVSVLVEAPIVIPPAVVGVALLQTFGAQGIFGPGLLGLGVRIPFTEAAVVLAQVVVSAPFFVQAATSAFREVDRDTIAVARTLGATPAGAFLRVALPIAMPGLLGGASLAWARSLGEFGATLLFAGNMPGTTQTLPLAIFTALESDVRLAVVFSLFLAGMGMVLLVGLRALSKIRRTRRPR